MLAQAALTLHDDALATKQDGSMTDAVPPMQSEWEQALALVALKRDKTA